LNREELKELRKIELERIHKELEDNFLYSINNENTRHKIKSYLINEAKKLESMGLYLTPIDYSKIEIYVDNDSNTVQVSPYTKTLFSGEEDII
jgi:hypothetical protein